MSIVQTGSFRRGRVLIIHASVGEHAHANAASVAARIRSHGMIVDLVDASVSSMPPPHDYDAIVLGTPRGFDAHTALIESYIDHHRDALGKVPTALFVACGHRRRGRWLRRGARAASELAS